MNSNPFYDFFASNLDFAIRYISLHYPFTTEQVKKYMPHLIMGEAYYPIYIQDTEQICKPSIGLSFNQNLEWTDELRAMWKVGIWQPFIGYYDGLDIGHVELSDYQNPDLNKMIPLDIHQLIHTLDSLAWEQAFSLYGADEDFPDNYSPTPDEVLNPIEYPKLTPAVLESMFKRNRTEVLINASIWLNTFKDVMTIELIEALIVKARLAGVDV